MPTLFMRAYGVTPRGNFEGSNILYVAQPIGALAAEAGLSTDVLDGRLTLCRRTLAEARVARVHPRRDDKVIAAWNGLMLRALAGAAAAYQNRDYRKAAEQTAAFLLDSLRRDGSLYRTYSNGEARIDAFLDDYAFLADGLVALYEATGHRRWLDEALGLANAMIDRFADPNGGPFYCTSANHEQLISRPREIVDNAVPSGNSVAAEVLLRLAVHTGQDIYHEHALHAIVPLQSSAAQEPLAFGRLLCAADMATSPQRELAIVGDPDSPETLSLLQAAHRRFDPNLVVAVAGPREAALDASPLFQGREQREGRATAYLCRDYACKAPVTSAKELAQIL